MLVLLPLFLLLGSASCHLIDLTHPYEEGYTMSWLTTKQFSFNVEKKGYRGDYWYESNNMCLGEHSGTHLDAPVHFGEGKWAVDEIPLHHLMGPAVVMDIQHKVDKDRNYALSSDDVIEWVNTYGPIPDNGIVLVRTGWDIKYGNKLDYFGSLDPKNVSFPGISLGAAQMFISNEKLSGNKVIGVGIDGPSLDVGVAERPDVHIELFAHNIYGLENLHNLMVMPHTGAHLTVMPMKIKGGSGAPCRVVAEVGVNGGPKINQNLYAMLTMVVFSLAIFS